MIKIIVAVANNGAMGLNNGLPWGHLKEDMAWFKHNTESQVVVMGRNTWDSLPPKFRPLPNRINIMLSRSYIPEYDSSEPRAVISRGTPEESLEHIKKWHLGQEGTQDIVIIGGKSVYEQYWPYADEILVTRINQDVEADTFLDVDALMDEHGFNIVESVVNGDKSLMFETWNKRK